MGSYEAGYLVGIAFGIVVGVVAIALFIKFTRHDRSAKCKYDERQEQIRGRGYKYGFFALLIYGAADVLFGEYLEGIAIREVVIAFGQLLGILVFVTYAIWHEGYFAMNEDPGRFLVLFSILSAVNLALAGCQIWRGHFLEDGRISYSAMNLLVGVMMLVIVAALLARRHFRKGQVEGQDDV